MPELTSIPLSKLKTYGNWKQAPVGALLQVRSTSNKAAIIGLRCQVNAAQNPTPCFLVLDGPGRGFLPESGLYDAAFDVAELIDIHVTDLAPMPFSEARLNVPGLVCEQVAGSGLLYVRAYMQSKTPVYVCLRDPSGNKPV